MRKPLLSRLGRRVGAEFRGREATPCRLRPLYSDATNGIADFRCGALVKVPSWPVVALCVAQVTLGIVGPIILEWLKDVGGGQYRFSVAAISFHAYSCSALMGIASTAIEGGPGALVQLYRPDMIWRFAVTACFFTAGDMLSFTSMLYLDAGTFSLVGKAFNIVATVFLTRAILRKRHTLVQYSLVAAVAFFTFAFCKAEMRVRCHGCGTNAITTAPQGNVYLGIAFRIAAVVFTSLAAVLQEKILSVQPGVPFLMQQCWMGCGALATSLVAFKVMYRLPISQLFMGFDDWRVCILLCYQVLNGLCAGLMVKKLGALAKSLCVPITLGGCYMYAVFVGSATFGFVPLAAWALSTICIVLFLVFKAKAQNAVEILPRASPAA